MIDLAPRGNPPRKGSTGLPRSAGPKLPPLPPPAPRRRSVLGAFVVLGFLATAAGGGWLWWQQQDIAARIGLPSAVAAPAAGTEGRFSALEQRLAQLEQRPAPAPDDRIGPLEQRLTALEQRPAPAPDERLGTLDQRLTALEQRPVPVPEVLPPEPPVAPPAAGSAEAAPVTEAFLATRLQTLERRVARAEQAISTGAARASRLQAARAALESGQKLGDIPGAPAALAKFAYANPPTEASLRLSFPAAASAATQASDPASAALPMTQRMWQKVQTLATIQEGEKVLVGQPVTRVLAQAQAKLDAGDLAGAVAALDPLDPAAAKAMAAWRDQAQALLDARAALAALARS